MPAGPWRRQIGNDVCWRTQTWCSCHGSLTHGPMQASMKVVPVLHSQVGGGGALSAAHAPWKLVAEGRSLCAVSGLGGGCSVGLTILAASLHDHVADGHALLHAHGLDSRPCELHGLVRAACSQASWSWSASEQCAMPAACNMAPLGPLQQLPALGCPCMLQCSCQQALAPRCLWQT